jgi:membrane carboxypeptidase/penicillin-binding protein PbpC
MAFLSPKKSLIRKAREAAGAVLCELFFTKDEILEWYINMAEFGDGVYGIRAAARHYFEIEPELLTIEHGANLALVLPSPNGWSKGLRQRRLTDFGHRRYAQIITAMRQNGFITETLWEHALATGDFGRPVKAYWQRKRMEALQEELAEEAVFEEGENPEEIEEGEVGELGQSSLERVNQSTEQESHPLDLGLPEKAEDVSPMDVEEEIEEPLAEPTELTEPALESVEPSVQSVPMETQSEEGHVSE